MHSLNKHGFTSHCIFLRLCCLIEEIGHTRDKTTHSISTPNPSTGHHTSQAMESGDIQLQRLWGMHDRQPVVRRAIESLIRAIFSHPMEIYFVTRTKERIRFVDNPRLRILDHFHRCFTEVTRTLCVTHVAPVCEARTPEGIPYPFCPDRGSYQICSYGQLTGNPYDVFVLTTQVQPERASSISAATVACGFSPCGPSTWRLQNAATAGHSQFAVTYGGHTGFSFFGEASSVGEPQPMKWYDVRGQAWPRRKGTDPYSSPNVLALDIMSPPSAHGGEFQTPLTSLLQWDDLVQCLLALTAECERKKAFQNVYLEMSYPPPPPASRGGDSNFDNPSRNPVSGTTTFQRPDGEREDERRGDYDGREEEGYGPQLLPTGMGGRFDPDYVEMDDTRGPVMRRSQRRLDAEEIHEENMAAAIHLSKFMAKFYKEMSKVREEYHQVSLGQLARGGNLIQSLTMPEIPDYWPLPQLPGGKIVAVPTPEVRGDVLQVVQTFHELAAAALGMPHALLIGASSGGSGGGTYSGVADNALRQSLETIESVGMRIQTLIAESWTKLYMHAATENAAEKRKQKSMQFFAEVAARRKEAKRMRVEGGAAGRAAGSSGGSDRIPSSVERTGAGGRVGAGRKRSWEAISEDEEDSEEDSDSEEEEEGTKKRSSATNSNTNGVKELQFTEGEDYLIPPEEGHIECILPGLVQVTQILELAKNNFLNWTPETREMIGKLLGLDPSLLNQKDPLILPGDLLKVQAEEIKAKATETAAGYEVDKAKAESKKAESAVEKAKVDVEKAKVTAAAAARAPASASAARR